MEKWQLKRTVQCAKCPWKISTNPFDIPYGYSFEKHKNLINTIANDLSNKDVLSVMACHHSKQGNEEYCVGWLNHQLGVGNNITLRLKMMTCENAKDIRVIGEQHTKFEDTLPK